MAKDKGIQKIERKSGTGFGKYVKGLIAVAILGLAASSITLMVGDIRENLAAFSKVRYDWFSIGIAAMIGFWLLDSFLFKELCRGLGMRFSLFQSIHISLLGQFYSAITPFATGGQPMQIYAMYKRGQKVSQSSAVFIAKFLLYQSVITIYGIFVLWISFSDVRMETPRLSLLAIGGFIVNSGAIFFMMLFAFSKRATTAILLGISSWFRWSRPGKKVYHWMEGFVVKLESFYQAMRQVYRNPIQILSLFLLTLCQMFFFFSVSYCTYRALGYSSAPFWEILAFQGVVFLVISFIPLPGASGAAESGFFLFFQRFFSRPDLAAAILLWRLVSYYLNIIVGGVCALRERKMNRV